MATYLGYDRVPQSIIGYLPVRGEGPVSRNSTSRILDLLEVAKSPSDVELAGGLPFARPSEAYSAGAVASQQPLRARASSLHVAVIRHNPNTLDRSPMMQPRGATSGNGNSMDNARPAGDRRRFSRIGEKNITRHQPHTLRLCQPSENAETLPAFFLSHGATDANGR